MTEIIKIKSFEKLSFQIQIMHFFKPQLSIKSHLRNVSKFRPSNLEMDMRVDTLESRSRALETLARL
jgi:hypothetical protein